MPNPYFQFKQFLIVQDQCTMKVCTDACILGAWFAEKIPLCSHMLDLGSGTGLLMLMMAQKNEADIHGIELDLDSFKQLKENIFQSKWKERLKAFPGDARNYPFPVKYDFIISNPPFFKDEHLAMSSRENVAKHSLELDFEELLPIIDTNLKPNGSFGVLLPAFRAAYFESVAIQFNFFPTEKLHIRQTPRHDYFRTVILFRRGRESFVPESELAIQTSEAKNTLEFEEMMKDYYLNL